MRLIIQLNFFLIKLHDLMKKDEEMRNLFLFKSCLDEKIKSEKTSNKIPDNLSEVIVNHNNMNQKVENPSHNEKIPNNFATIKRRFSESYYKGTEISKRPRLVKKCGELNIHMEYIPKHKRRLLRDFFNTILDIKWRWHIAIFLLSFLVSWIFFASIWYSIAWLHGDLKTVEYETYHDQPGLNSTSIAHSHAEIKTNKNLNQTPCVFG